MYVFVSYFNRYIQINIFLSPVNELTFNSLCYVHTESIYNSILWNICYSKIHLFQCLFLYSNKYSQIFHKCDKRVNLFNLRLVYPENIIAIRSVHNSFTRSMFISNMIFQSTHARILKNICTYNMGSYILIFHHIQLTIPYFCIPPFFTGI